MSADDVVLHHVAPWNDQLGNPYRTRWAEHGGLKFKVAADDLYGPWWVEVVDQDGRPTSPMQAAGLRLAHSLADARQIIRTWQA